MTFKIYTKTGDAGETSLFGGKRILKSELQIECYGTMDELNAAIGLLRDTPGSSEFADLLGNIQDHLMRLGTVFAYETPEKIPSGFNNSDFITFLENHIDQLETQVPPLKNFVLPGGNLPSSHCQLARCICRRAERCIVRFIQSLEAEEIALYTIPLTYMNRLSDLLFVLARTLLYRNGGNERIWKTD